MSIKKKQIFPIGCFCLGLLYSSGLEADQGIHYKVTYVGLDDPAILKTIKSASQLTILEKHKPSSMHALRYRAEADIPEILKIFHANGYLEAKASFHLEEIDDNQVLVQFAFDAGPLYRFGPLSIHAYEQSTEKSLLCPLVNPAHLGIVSGKAALSNRVIFAEIVLIDSFASCGYPLAKITEKKFIADAEKKVLNVHFTVDLGPPCLFGSLRIEGLSNVKADFVLDKLGWTPGDVYDYRLVEKTQSKLVESGLFSTVQISHDQFPDEQDRLNLLIEIVESKHNTLDVGVTYQTVYGPGVTLGWETRNLSGMGRRLSLQGDATWDTHSGIASYIFPDFFCKGIDYLWQGQAMHMEITPFNERSYNLINRFDIRFNDWMRMSIGVKGERLFVSQSVDNGNFWLLEMPLFLRWSSANSLLNPTKGNNVEYKAVPALNFNHNKDPFLYQKLTHGVYFPLNDSHSIVLAQKITFAMMLSDNLSVVPVPKRIFGGSEEDLRGYKYYTVSPLEGNKPIGGRSALFYTLELRLRIVESFGIVPFFDMGNVYLTQLPTFRGKWLKSVGLGFRYFSIIGPIRLDVGFPLNPRKDIDSFARFLISIGQSF